MTGVGGRTSRTRRLVSQVVAAVIMIALSGGCGLVAGPGSATASKLKPVTGQTFPNAFGDRNTRVLTVTERPGSAFYKDSSGRTFTIVLNESSADLAEAAKRQKPENTRTYEPGIVCFNVVTNPQLCHKQIDGGWLTFSSSQEWDGERIAQIMRDFYAQMKD